MQAALIDSRDRQKTDAAGCCGNAEAPGEKRRD